MDARVQSKADIIYASRIVVSSGNRPTRVVLRKLPGQFVTHKEYLDSAAPIEGTSCRFVHHAFESGNYFDFRTDPSHDFKPTEEDARKRAEEDFINRERDL